MNPPIATWSVTSSEESRRILREDLGNPQIILASFNNPLTGGGGIGTVMRSLERHLPQFHILSWNPHEQPHQSTNERWIWPIEISADILHGFQRVFLKQYIWPRLHGLRALISDTEIEAARPIFEAGNRLFTDGITALAGRLDRKTPVVVWINDYALAWCISGIRARLGASVRIGISFRSSFGGKHYPKLLAQDAQELVNSLCCADFVSFHRRKDAEHLAQLCMEVDEVSGGDGAVSSRLERPRTPTYFCAVPMGNDPVAIREIASSEKTEALMERYRAAVGNGNLVLSISRLEHHKSILREVQMIESLLQVHPELVGTFTMIRVMPIPPEYQSIKDYSDLLLTITSEVNRLNQTFAAGSWRPFILLSGRFYNRHEVVALMRLANVVIVASSADGFSHIPFESLLSKKESDPTPVLVLSDVGATDYLSGAYLPLEDVDSGEEAALLLKALTMPDNVKSAMFAIGQRQAESLSAHQWAVSVLTAIVKPELLRLMAWSEGRTEMPSSAPSGRCCS